MPQQLDKIANELRSAILAADPANAARLVTEYVEALCQEWEHMPPQDRACSQLPQVAKELLKWARDMTMVQRALTSKQLDILDKVIEYRRSASLQEGGRAIEVRI